MAQRRMFSLKIIDTDSFLAMPTSSRLLYYDLAMRADDDGFISSPQKIVKMTGAALDDLKILEAKKYIIPFETGVCVIKHWHIHNLIRSDRYNETDYLDEKKTLKLINNKYEDVGCQNVIPYDNQMEPQVRIGKDRITDTMSPADAGGEQQMVLNAGKKEGVPYQAIVDLYHKYLGKTSTTVKILSSRRTVAIKGRWNHELKSLEEWDAYFERASKSDFLNGRTKHLFYADFDWLINQANCIKLLEDKYSNDRR